MSTPELTVEQKSAPEFTVEFLNPETLVPSPANFRRHPSLQREALDSSISEHGWLSAPIVNKQTNRILDGHARVELAAENGEATIPVRVVDVSEEQEKRILASFDQIGSLAERDDEALTVLLQELAESAEGLPAGWQDSDLETLLAEIAPVTGREVTAPDEFPEVNENLKTQFCCPRCQYSWSGKPA
jgi:hypothetical protein